MIETKDKNIEGFPNYTISISSTVKNRSRKIIKSRLRGEYMAINLSHNGKKKTFNVHILVAKTFIANPEKKPVVNHKDGNKLNNHLSNLEWVTYSENSKHSLQTVGKKSNARGVIKCDLEGNEIERFSSITEAERKTGVGNGHIVGVCKGRLKAARGFKWKYIISDKEKISINLSEFKDIQGFEDFYSINRKGEIYNKKSGKLVKPSLNPNGYPRIILYKEKKDSKNGSNKLVHKLVAETFISNKPEGKDVINHKNGNKNDYRVENLEWNSYSENNIHSCFELKKKGVLPIIKYKWNEEGTILFEVNRFKTKGEACIEAGFISENGNIHYEKMTKHLSGKLKDDEFVWEIDQD